ncbi:hypothetical protein PF005_g29004 [Phytophthora fragariae]|uniref:Uncharacterized protein n=1 Tax=Phytophthora fragariae TaxID=53985 RepID=A0A6A3QPF6_9STRA|nr:hypothetical protein PF003_g20504 [Phytophthora fragariae]KAE8920554.1 hypothetical protein PF009_g29156 [Phytophthora fragariae]KAE9067799.1 hypothetical protein PF010_g27322 [Phytophthora fragariae]KAE9069205.1 hypothetical protein PF007_g27406 [Phytophthora fragariae]KAE9080638.1 hypothetical protein PF006_g27277 [Phytophthora fragariae]
MSFKKKPIFWDRDAVKEGKSSLQVVLDWLSTEMNYNKWRGSDRINENTKEALLKAIVSELKAVGIVHRTTGDIREKISAIERQFREAVDFQVQTGSGITTEATLRGEILKRCPYYYKLADVFDSRPSARPSITSDGIDEEDEEASSSNAIVQRSEKRPLAFDDDDFEAKRQQKDPVEKLSDQQLTASKQRAQKDKPSVAAPENQVGAETARNQAKRGASQCRFSSETSSTRGSAARCRRANDTCPQTTSRQRGFRRRIDRLLPPPA